MTVGPLMLSPSVRELAVVTSGFCGKRVAVTSLAARVGGAAEKSATAASASNAWAVTARGMAAPLERRKTWRRLMWMPCAIVISSGPPNENLPAPPTTFGACGAPIVGRAVPHQIVQQLLRASPDELAYRPAKRLVGEGLPSNLIGDPVDSPAARAHESLTDALFHDLFEQAWPPHM